MGCGCPSMQGIGYLGATNPCDQTGAWMIVRGSDGKCYNLCIFTGERMEIDAASCVDAVDIPAGWTPGQPITKSLIPGVDNTYLMIGGAALVVLLLVMSRR